LLRLLVGGKHCDSNGPVSIGNTPHISTKADEGHHSLKQTEGEKVSSAVIACMLPDIKVFFDSLKDEAI